jgi:hypothetical protein
MVWSSSHWSCSENTSRWGNLPDCQTSQVHISFLCSSLLSLTDCHLVVAISWAVLWATMQLGFSDLRRDVTGIWMHLMWVDVLLALGSQLTLFWCAVDDGSSTGRTWKFPVDLETTLVSSSTSLQGAFIVFKIVGSLTYPKLLSSSGTWLYPKLMKSGLRVCSSRLSAISPLSR